VVQKLRQIRQLTRSFTVKLPMSHVASVDSRDVMKILTDENTRGNGWCWTVDELQ